MNAGSLAPDEELMSRLKGGDIEAFNGLYDRYSRRLLYFICRMLSGDEALAQDVLQEVFLAMVENKGRFRRGNRFSTWIFTIARNKIKNIYRFRSGKSFQDIAANEERLFFSDAVDVRMDMKKFKRSLAGELAALSEEERGTFWLRFQEGFAAREIGEILGCPEGTVHSRLHTIIKKISGRLSEYRILLEEVSHG
jgi:RNA polymerase sigma-70 factor, ECF subfamily